MKSLLAHFLCCCLLAVAPAVCVAETDNQTLVKLSLKAANESEK